MAETAIEWTERTWNPIVGCSIVSPGCTNCYAMKMARRLDLMGVAQYSGLTQQTKAGAVWTGKLALAPAFTMQEPLRRRKPTTYFVNSMGDLFHEDVPDAWVDQAFAIMALCPQHTFQVLTKRADRMRDYLGTRAGDWMLQWPEAIPAGRWRISKHEGMSRLGANGPVAAALYSAKPMPWPLPNVWLGVSAEDQKRADERIPELLATPAAVRFVSAEPLLGPIDFRNFRCDEIYSPDSDPHNNLDALTGEVSNLAVSHTERRAKLDWIIVGGESGPGARPMHPDWPRQIRDQCAAAGTAFFFKQWGEWCPISDMSEEQSDACYFPAPQRHPEATRRERKPNCVLHSSGRRFDGRDRYSYGAFLQGSGAMTMFQIGKSSAGRRLDGVEHNAMPDACR